MNNVTAKDFVDTWTSQLNEFYDRIVAFASPRGWSSIKSNTDITEDPFHLGASIAYDAPVLTLKRADPQGNEQRITFEPRHRFIMGAAGRIDVYSYPQFREAMFLRIADTSNAETLTWDQAEERVANAPWKAFSQGRLPLRVDLADGDSVREFFEDLVA